MLVILDCCTYSSSLLACSAQVFSKVSYLSVTW